MHTLVHGENHPVPSKLLSHNSHPICLSQHLFHNSSFHSEQTSPLPYISAPSNSMETAGQLSGAGKRPCQALLVPGISHLAKASLMEVLAQRSSREPSGLWSCADDMVKSSATSS